MSGTFPQSCDCLDRKNFPLFLSKLEEFTLYRLRTLLFHLDRQLSFHRVQRPPRTCWLFFGFWGQPLQTNQHVRSFYCSNLHRGQIFLLASILSRSFSCCSKEQVEGFRIFTIPLLMFILPSFTFDEASFFSMKGRNFSSQGWLA